MLQQPNTYAIEALARNRIEEQRRVAREHKQVQAIRRQNNVVDRQDDSMIVTERRVGWLQRLTSAVLHARA